MSKGFVKVNFNFLNAIICSIVEQYIIFYEKILIQKLLIQEIFQFQFCIKYHTKDKEIHTTVFKCLPYSYLSYEMLYKI